ncbi:MAG: carboxylating nicotinate-nucleotide diphosphorylase [Dehalococcoidia bacterium]|nr:carboxylating nicotinate-nucleotide diphosphorylase [Dehalococcoidia bacterium]MSQ17179.1 carboxylating nicotinate-nucleotide diphosphorylase [Dehalococcoidia bacterium]
MNSLPPEVHQLIDLALSEDQTFSDPTTGLLIPADVRGSGVLRAKASGVLAGAAVALAVFQRVDPELETVALLPDGAALTPGTDIACIEGSAGSILRGERIALNFLQRMSGIASDTRRYVDAVRGCRARIVDTRKTVPGHRYLDKYSVRMGGGHNHRLNLADGILIKDNHIAALASQEMGLEQVVKLAMERAPHTIKVEVEVENLEQLREALAAGAPVIMLDNMPVELMRRAVGIVAGRAVVEASGGITLDTVRAVAETGVDLISIGGLTHSVKALDISLDLEFS